GRGAPSATATTNRTNTPFDVRMCSLRGGTPLRQPPFAGHSSGMRRATFAALLIMMACGSREPPVDLEHYRHNGPIVLVTIDTLRADRVGVYGSSRNLTPNIDALVATAAQALLFQHAAAQVPLTLPYPA